MVAGVVFVVALAVRVAVVVVVVAKAIFLILGLFAIGLSRACPLLLLLSCSFSCTTFSVCILRGRSAIKSTATSDRSKTKSAQWFGRYSVLKKSYLAKKCINLCDANEKITLSGFESNKSFGRRIFAPFVSTPAKEIDTSPTKLTQVRATIYNKLAIEVPARASGI